MVLKMIFHKFETNIGISTSSSRTLSLQYTSAFIFIIPLFRRKPFLSAGKQNANKKKTARTNPRNQQFPAELPKATAKKKKNNTDLNHTLPSLPLVELNQNST